MTSVNIITYPDKLYNYANSFLLVHPSQSIKTEITNIVSEGTMPLNIYYYEPDEPQIEWLIDVTNNVNKVLIDVDNCPPITKDILSYLIAHPNVFWLTKGENIVYNTINKFNRVWNVDILLDQIKGD